MILLKIQGDCSVEISLPFSEFPTKMSTGYFDILVVYRVEKKAKQYI